ncbi:isoleucine--tRNA ligase, chloroplastic/mitochondrial-like [Lactuca sativa]|uniref:isoleucine--tRNA ligase, chloroplastic/mitochondrial-like n=1 Tax=Lactuca sativa TaxID=4236 RepID=UPI0022AEEAB0|nr:isoleucine--tRNA ligase, chloroplastic/mitochondrial-like [Lactuca sativa]
MKDLGIPEEKTKPDLKRLLQLCDKNWELIEEKNYRALADAIFDTQESEEVEHKKKLDVLHSLDQDARNGLTPIKLRAKSAKFAKATVKAQMASFKRFGVWADWDHPYLTLDPEYEAAQIEVFGQMVFKRYIYRRRKPVHWSPSSRTALAEAELEYPEVHVSKSMYAIFKLLTTPTKDGLLDEFPKLSLAIWTTTPWTIPANAAVAVNSKLQYAIVEVQSPSPDVTSSSEDGKKRIGSVLKGSKIPFFIVALDLLSTLESKWNVKLVVKKTVFGSDLENCRYAHPINGEECPVVIGGDYITTESGTGLVHTAPGHGQDDYITGLKYNLPIISPVDDEGKFTEEAGIFKGLDVLGDGNVAVIDHLDQLSSIIMVEPYKHKYPYDWRTKKPTIFRATAQWFASVEGFREAAMDAISQVVWTPSQVLKKVRFGLLQGVVMGLQIPTRFEFYFASISDLSSPLQRLKNPSLHFNPSQLPVTHLPTRFTSLLGLDFVDVIAKLIMFSFSFSIYRINNGFGENPVKQPFECDD